ncbi:hypothetical protein NPA30_05835 [Aurantimonas sp. CSK15Z-1]|nr:hypothetical protein [Aurantimonas sp. CSK15Z-1]MCQ8781699.1 hypothetical protein [Aurantimonas sp. CSK15Z-1]
MADGTKIEWTDATSDGGRTFRRDNRDIRKLKASDKPIRRGSAVLRQPLPNISVALAAVAAKASWDDVRGLGQPAMANGDNVIPSFGWLVAVGAQPIELLHDERVRARRDHLNTPAAQNCPRPSSLAKFWARRVSVAHFCISAGLANALSSHRARRQPRLASTAPCLTLIARLLPVCLGRSGSHSHIPARAADIGVAVEPRSIFGEFGQRLRFSAAAAFLRAVDLPRNKPAVCGTAIFGDSHAL